MIPRPDMPWSANEGRPLDGYCAWVRDEALPILVARLRSFAASKRDGGRLSARVEAFIQALPDFFGARMEFLAAAPTKNVRFVMGHEIPDRYAVLMLAIRAPGDDDIGIHFLPSMVGVSNPMVAEAEGAVMAPSATHAGPERIQ